VLAGSDRPLIVTSGAGGLPLREIAEVQSSIDALKALVQHGAEQILLHGHPTIDRQNLAGDVPGLWTCNEGHGGGDILALPELG
jgi:hypothetical protein